MESGRPRATLGLGPGQDAEEESLGAWGAVTKPGVYRARASMAGAPCQRQWEPGTGPSAQAHLATSKRHPGKRP